MTCLSLFIILRPSQPSRMCSETVKELASRDLENNLESVRILAFQIDYRLQDCWKEQRSKYAATIQEFKSSVVPGQPGLSRVPRSCPSFLRKGAQGPAWFSRSRSPTGELNRGSDWTVESRPFLCNMFKAEGKHWGLSGAQVILTNQTTTPSSAITKEPLPATSRGDLQSPGFCGLWCDCLPKLLHT